MLILISKNMDKCNSSYGFVYLIKMKMVEVQEVNFQFHSE